MRCALVVVWLAAQTALGAVVNPITAVTPTGTRNGGASQPTVLTSITAASQTWNGTDLYAPPSEAFVELVPSAAGFNAGRGSGLSNPADVRTTMVGLQAGYSALGISDVTEAIRGYFDRTIPIDGWVFVLEWATGKDNFKIQLLDNAPGGAPNVVATVNVANTDYVNTALVVASSSVGNQPVGGVAIKLSELNLGSTTGITGVQLPGDAPAGGVTGLDPCIIAAALPEPSTLMILLTAVPILRRRR